MGLDMYLRKNVTVRRWKCGKSGMIDAQSADVTVRMVYPDGSVDTTDFGIMNPELDIQISLPVAYWRKANAIHRWFVEQAGDGEDNCEPICVLGKKLIELRDLCQEVLDDHDKAEELLPTQKGFFFGSTEYDQWYFDDLKHTVDCLKDVDPDGIYEYRASW